MADLKPVYLLHGDDDAKLDAWRKRVRARVEQEGSDATLEVLAGDRLSAEAIVDATRSMTLGMGSSYVIADGIEKLKDADVKLVCEALSDLGTDTVIVLIATGKVSKGSGPASAKLAKAVEKAGGEVHLCAAPSAASLPGWVCSQAQDLGLAIDRPTAALLVERAGTSQQRLLRELEKLQIYLGEGETIDAEQVELLVALDVDPRTYQLADAIVARDSVGAMRVAEELRDSGEDLMPILFGVLRKLRDVRTAWALVGSGASQGEIQSRIGGPPWIAKRLVSEARKADGEQLERAIGSLSDLDYAIRGGFEIDADTSLTLMLEGMTGESQPAAAGQA